MFKPKHGVAILGVAILSALFVGAPADRRPVKVCAGKQRCPICGAAYKALVPIQCPVCGYDPKGR